MSRQRTDARPRSRGRRLILLLLIVPFVGTLWVSTYARTAPSLLGFPFFYWYQFLWIGISAALTVVVYLVDPEAPGADEDRA